MSKEAEAKSGREEPERGQEAGSNLDAFAPGPQPWPAFGCPLGSTSGIYRSAHSSGCPSSVRNMCKRRWLVAVNPGSKCTFI